MNTEDANSILAAVNVLPLSQVRPLSLQTLLKFISSVYQERRKPGAAGSQTPLHVYSYDFFISQYGLKKIADEKLRKVSLAVAALTPNP